jgi:hypothetical protein
MILPQLEKSGKVGIISNVWRVLIDPRYPHRAHYYTTLVPLGRRGILAAVIVVAWILY